ncbi:MAG: hypothetical protein R2873_27085 [Caldilineaceae bacterium]
MEIVHRRAADAAIPGHEFEIGPNGILDAKGTAARRSQSILARRRGLGRTQPALARRVQRATLVLPSADLPWMAIAPAREKPAVWRANFYRIERPREGRSVHPTEFSCWSPTLTEPADFHRPARFGILTLSA